MTGKKVLIAYYSHSGNTKNTAQKIHSLVGGDIIEITPTTPYPNNYDEIVSLAKKEKAQDFRPELTKNYDISNYDTIYLGTPVWWYTFASPIRTFLSSYDFSGKTIIPFCTHGGGGASSTYTDIKKLCPSSSIKEGYSSYENSSNTEDIKKWIDNTNKQ